MANGDKVIPGGPPGMVIIEGPETAEQPQVSTPAVSGKGPPGMTIIGDQSEIPELEILSSRAYQLDRAIQQIDDPEEGYAGVQNSFSFSRVLEMPVPEAHMLRNEIAKQVSGDPGATQKTFWNRLAETAKTGAKSGHSGLQAGLIQEKLYEEAFQLSLEALAGNWNQERYNGIMELQQQIHSLAPS